MCLVAWTWTELFTLQWPAVEALYNGSDNEVQSTQKGLMLKWQIRISMAQWFSGLAQNCSFSSAVDIVRSHWYDVNKSPQKLVTCDLFRDCILSLLFALQCKLARPCKHTHALNFYTSALFAVMISLFVWLCTKFPLVVCSPWCIWRHLDWAVFMTALIALYNAEGNQGPWALIQYKDVLPV